MRFEKCMMFDYLKSKELLATRDEKMKSMWSVCLFRNFWDGSPPQKGGGAMAVSIYLNPHAFFFFHELFFLYYTTRGDRMLRYSCLLQYFRRKKILKHFRQADGGDNILGCRAWFWVFIILICFTGG
jgi:hypothetical protein